MASSPPLVQVPVRAVYPYFRAARGDIRVTQPDHDLGTVSLCGLVGIGREPYVKRCVVGSLPRLVHREVSPWLVIGGDLDRPVSLRSDSPLPAAEDVRISCHLRAVSRALDNFKALFAVVLKPG